MKYKLKPIKDEVVDAILFKYSSAGIEQLKEFCGSSLISTNKSRSPFAIGFAEIVWASDQPNSCLLVEENNYITKCVDNGVEWYNTLSPNEFNARYERILSNN
jgi:hypothetical protein